MQETYPFRAAFLAQLSGGVVVGIAAWGMGRLVRIDPGEIFLLLAMLQGSVAAITARLQRAPLWWLLIHLGFAPLAVVVQRLNIEPFWFLVAFVLFWVVFGRTDKSRVPLYLTNRVTVNALAKLIPPGAGKIIDLGCGEGGLLRSLALVRPDCSFVGVEHAYLTCFVAHLRTFHLPNVTIRHGNFWEEPLEDYCVVYGFLSPAPMHRLWKKLQREMAQDALFVSNSFPVPDVNPGQIIKVADRRATHLYLYQTVPSTPPA